MTQPASDISTTVSLGYDGHAPLFRAPEKIRTVFIVTLVAACLPLAGGILFCGYRAAWVAAIAIASCAVFERFYFRVTHTPALLGRSHAYLTGMLLALTLPPFTPWWVVVMAAAFAIIVGKAIFGGVGHFLWQPALLGRFAVAVIVPILASLGIDANLTPDQWPLLAPQHMLLGDIADVQPLRPGEIYRGWQDHDLPEDDDGWAVPLPTQTLRPLTVATV
ncbi:MAG: RnfABCDGE type electron transport complex subunit D, partial [Phycisphaerae bacterium]|nr:RnfABCDGE type electron transport complex subunit D [Phycisphaerae bacterium]